ncbi:hypothetical protein PVAG01_09663 [Phlyctema vagabunda]|uniref:Uncharacterized protein n=1 Tax=Phlyctema vagabunda TaxID=108571 RepID=A0ABR4P805_9HELO
MDTITRLEWPNAEPRFLQLLACCDALPAGNINQTCKALVDYEISLCNIRDDFDYDFNAALTSLYYRARCQSAIWDIFMHLWKRGLVVMECLQRPIDIQNPSDEVVTLIRILRCLEGAAGEVLNEEYRVFPRARREGYLIQGALNWLATVIDRSPMEVEAILNEITRSRHLGVVNNTAFRELVTAIDEEIIMQRDTEEAAPRQSADGYVSVDEYISVDDSSTRFGFWLPDNLGERDFELKIVLALERFEAIERCFIKHFLIQNSNRLHLRILR